MYCSLNMCKDMLKVYVEISSKARNIVFGFELGFNQHLYIALNVHGSAYCSDVFFRLTMQYI